ncbi:hypothetical protein bpr_II297 (plasmid) [Butyrivibrio proteoclasticus B316]|uniref:Uncharacterized protein n=1 Tax=Butyrivibrio proteoclasticus (strain ATCC 51982 / DSM 14932 / B316) TaxID=515622 RepID=E0S4A2_BUTPB|nr:hypothetical protein bpr_II297 [Butyrivibrio proteoclasticus B316]
MQLLCGFVFQEEITMVSLYKRRGLISALTVALMVTSMNINVLASATVHYENH